jgi:hydrogenase maturation protein HypF
VSQHIGDLDSLETMRHFQESLRGFRDLFRIEPEIVVRDLHPGYLSTRLAEEIAEALGSRNVMVVQHHHAHVAAVLAEHGETGPLVGLAFDGTGYGDDGKVWGAEVLVADLETYRRAGHLRYSPLPGGEAAVRNPWRTALGYLSLQPESEEAFGLACSDISEADRRVVARQAVTGVNAPLASSMGRLFDAAAAVLGLRNRCGFEGQAAMEMEAAAGRLDGHGGAPFVERWDSQGVRLPFPFQEDSSGMFVMNPLPLLSALGDCRQTGSSLALLAMGFHWAVARTSADLAGAVCEREGLASVALCGGVFQNALLLGMLKEMLEEMGLRVLVPRRLGPNDGAISYGQVAVAASRLVGRG